MMMARNRFSGPMGFLGNVLTMILACAVAFACLEAAAPQQAQAGKVKKAKKVLKFVAKGAQKFERKMRNKGKFGRAVGRAVGKAGRGAGKLRSGISKAQRGVGRVVGKVCRGACGKALSAGRKIQRGVDRLERKAFQTVTRGARKALDSTKRNFNQRRGAMRGAVRQGHRIPGKIQQGQRQFQGGNRISRGGVHNSRVRSALGRQIIRSAPAIKRQVIRGRSARGWQR